ncbi:TonB-dependent receptor [Novosphingobium sp. 1949]|uniref:TonB-dependent receptor n=1 Tax=Novosphingobium organovorum TaxID=2930092 RepID=A0ABT0BIY3_9SPHN|nr:TonB-dependent receptor [Novosphingobium organovorum]MCJ2185023.1 TonB-dependent receptor [Novosphingobium organovorum]
MQHRHPFEGRRALLAIVAGLAAPCIVPFAATPALAEDADAGARTIVVTGTGLDDTPATPAYDVETLDRETITTSASGRIEDTLSSVAGFQQYRRSDSRSSNPSAQGATLRALGGNASSRALVLLDGVPVTNPFFGYVPFSALAPERLGSIRVTRGGGAGAFGAGAISGTIELASAGPDQIGTLDGSALVNDRGGTQVSATTAQKLGEGFIVASGQWDRGPGFWTTPSDQRVDASARAAYESWSASLRAVAPLAPDLEIQASGLVYGDQRTLRFKGADSSSSGQQASLRLVGRGDWQFDVLGYVQAQNFSNVTISSTRYVKALDQRKTPTLATGGKFELRPPVGNDHVLRLGSDLRLVSGHLVESPYSTSTGLATAFRRAGGDQSDLGFFAQDDWTLGTLVLTAGARADRWTIRNGFYRSLSAAGAVTQDTTYANRDGWNTSFRGGLVWHLAPVVALRAAAYSSLRLPTLNELYRPYVVYPITTNANAALKPERLRGYEAGLELTPATGISLSLTAFDNRLKDAIANVTIDDTTRERQNVDAIHARGLEASAALRLGQISFDGSLSWTHAEVEATGDQAALDGMRPAQVPKLAASATLAWTPRDRWRFATTLRHVGRQFEDDLETEALPAATTLDAYAQVPVFTGFSVILRGENLFDERIVTRDQSGSIDLGTPRTLWAGFRVQI